MVGRELSEQDRIAGEGKGAGTDRRILLKTFYIVEPGNSLESSLIMGFLRHFLVELTANPHHLAGSKLKDRATQSPRMLIVRHQTPPCHRKFRVGGSFGQHAPSGTCIPFAGRSSSPKMSSLRSKDGGGRPIRFVRPSSPFTPGTRGLPRGFGKDVPGKLMVMQHQRGTRLAPGC
jgi:hypothetical protein